jgi:hypothetical protein
MAVKALKEKNKLKRIIASLKLENLGFFRYERKKLDPYMQPLV